jgi:hypothetical protein
MNYPIGMPLLFLPCVVLADRGWTIWHATCYLSDVQKDERALRQSPMLLNDSRSSPAVAPRRVLGNLSAPWAASNSLPAVWLTPLLADTGLHQSIAASRCPALLIGGSADPHMGPEGR